MRSKRLVLLALGIVFLGCTRDRRDAEGLPSELPSAPQRAPSLTPPEPLFDAEGELLPSNRMVAGMPLPRGTTVLIDEPRRHVYRNRAPLVRVQRYFGIRLITGAVDRTPGGGIVYHDAVVRDVRGAAVRLDVRVEPSSASEARIEIVETPPPMVNPPPEAETLERLRQELEQAD